MRENRLSGLGGGRQREPFSIHIASVAAPPRQKQAPALLGVAMSPGQFITNRSATLTDKGVKSEDLKTRMADCCVSVQASEQSQANAKTALKAAAQLHNDTVAERYPEFISVIDLLRGGVGNNSFGQATDDMDEYPQAA
jgi:hypothetical protein